MKMSLFIDYHGVSEIEKIRITLIVCLSSAAATFSSRGRSGVEAIVEKEHARWIKRNAVKSRKRAAEKVTYERRRRNVDPRKRQRVTEANGSRKRTIDQYFRF